MDTPAPQNTPPVRILIVDDHPNTASMLARVLSKFDTPVQVFTAHSGEDAMEIIGDGFVDILITDFMMAGMSGLDLIEKLKKERQPTHTILITAYDTPGLAYTVRQLKIQDYLVKPVQPDRIREIVAKVLREIRPEQAKISPSLQQRPFKILIADDYADNTRLLSTRLRSEGYDFVTAEDGEETLVQLRNEKPDLMLLDVNMPKKDGFEVLAEMRADPKIAHIPVIVITAARIMAKDIREGLTLGADDYVTKPVDWGELAARIRSKLRVKRAEDILRARNQELGVLPEISLDLGEHLDIEALTGTILSRTVRALEASNGHLVIFHPDGSITHQFHVIFDFSPWTWEEVEKRTVHEGIVANAVASRECVIVADTQKDESWLKIPNDPTRSAIAIPLVGRSSVLGVLTLVHDMPEHFRLEHQTILQAIASQAVMAIENAQLFATERKHVNELVALNQLTHVISKFTHSSELFERLPQIVHQILGYPTVALWLVDGEARHKLKLQGIDGLEQAVRRSLLEIAPQKVAQTGQPAQFSGPIEERNSQRVDGGKPPVQSVTAVPLFWDDKIRGVLSIHSSQPSAFQESDRVLLEMLAAQVGTVLDRIRLFEAAEQEQKRLSAVLHSAADAILVIDTQGCLRLTNSAAEQLFTDAHLGTPLPMKKGYDDLVDLLNKQRQNGNPEQAEVTWPDQRTFSVLVTPVEEGGQVAVLHDVSHFKAIDHLKSEFIATASHDLKNPIFAVLGYSDLLEKAGPLNELQSDFVNRVRNASIQMRDLVMNLLEMARMDMGMKLKLESVDLNETLTSVVEEFQPQADARHHLIMVELSTTPACVMGDKIRLQQVARNLFSNAIKYTPDGGQITVSSEVGSDRVLVNFRDTGIGIPEDSLPHLFEKFYRVHTKETQDIEGNGLGLAIVKSIIEQHGGRVTVESTLGKGSCFRVEFPMGKKDM